MRTSKKISQNKKKICSFVADGECEFWYLQMLRNSENIRIAVSPEMYQKKSMDEQYDKVVSYSEDSEKVFWIIDFDVILKETRECKKGKEPALVKFKKYAEKLKDKKYANVEIVVNNPCLEFWFLLHFCQTTKYFESYDKLLPNLKKQATLSNYEKTEKYFTKGTDIYKRLKPYLETAIENASKCGKFNFEQTSKGISEMNKIFENLGLTEKE